VLKRLADPKLKANNKLKDQIPTIDWKNDVFELVYITFGKLDNQARKISEQKPNYPDSVSDIYQRCSWTYLGGTRRNRRRHPGRSAGPGGIFGNLNKFRSGIDLGQVSQCGKPI
jgi:hypothetical protein